MKKKFAIIILGSFLLISVLGLSLVKALTVNSTNVTLYTLGTTYEDKLTIPNDLKKSFQITTDTTEKVTYKVTKGESVEVSSTGLITPKLEVWYCKGNWCSTKEDTSEGVTIRRDVITGESTVQVTAGTQTQNIVVNVVDYAKYNAEKIMKDYVKENITKDMTDMQKMQKIMDLIKYTKYSVYSSSYVGLFSGDGADCIGDSDAILYMCDLAGITAHMRFANRDAGAGSNHHNVAALLDGKLYVVDVVSIGNTPRPISIESTDNGFSTGSSMYLQYDGYDENAVIDPNGKITKLGDWLMYYGSHGDTVVKTVTIPKKITDIGIGAFNRVPTLTDVIVAEDNPNYKSEKGVLYSKDGTILHSYPSGKKESTFTIPSFVKTIKKYSMSYNANLQNVIIPNGVEKIEPYAFYGVENLIGIVLPESVSEIGDDAFDINIGVGTYEDVLRYLVVKNPKATLGKNLCSTIEPIYGLANSTAEAYAKENNCPFGVITTDQNTFKLITDLDISIPDIEYSGDRNIPNIIIKDGSYTLQENKDFKVIEYLKIDQITDYAQVRIYGIGNYAGFTDLTFKIKAIDIAKAEVTGINDAYLYNNNEDIEPEPVVTYNGKILEKDKDYYLRYSSNYRPGKATLTIKGKGQYGGQIDVNFEIVTESDIKLSLPENTSLNLNSTKKLKVTFTPNIEVPLTWSSSAPDIVSVDNEGKITAHKKGTAVITAKNGYFNTTKTTVTVKDYLKGDLNKDSEVDTKDAMEALYIVVGKSKQTADAILVGDLDNSNSITTNDAIEILRIYLRKA